MKDVLKFIATTLILTALLSSCSEPTAPSVGTDLLTYSISGSDESLKVDVTYMSDAGLVKIADQSLPWAVSVDLPKNYDGDGYLKVDVPQDEVFISYMSGTTDAVPVKLALIDADVNFISSGVAVGDLVYNSQSSLQYSKVTTIDDVDSLSLDVDLLTAGNETYYLYKTKSLTVEISVNNEVIEAKTVESERVLSCLVKTVIGM